MKLETRVKLLEQLVKTQDEQIESLKRMQVNAMDTVIALVHSSGGIVKVNDALFACIPHQEFTIDKDYDFASRQTIYRTRRRK